MGFAKLKSGLVYCSLWGFLGLVGWLVGFCWLVGFFLTMPSFIIPKELLISHSPIKMITKKVKLMLLELLSLTAFV